MAARARALLVYNVTPDLSSEVAAAADGKQQQPQRQWRRQQRRGGQHAEIFPHPNH